MFITQFKIHISKNQIIKKHINKKTNNFNQYNINITYNIYNYKSYKLHIFPQKKKILTFQQNTKNIIFYYIF